MLQWWCDGEYETPHSYLGLTLGQDLAYLQTLEGGSLSVSSLILFYSILFFSVLFYSISDSIPIPILSFLFVIVMLFCFAHLVYFY